MKFTVETKLKAYTIIADSLNEAERKANIRYPAWQNIYHDNFKEAQIVGETI